MCHLHNNPVEGGPHLGLNSHAIYGIHQNNAPVTQTNGRRYFAREIDVARGVQQVQQIALTYEERRPPIAPRAPQACTP